MIKVLDSFISDKIAAGEVIERPSSVVKELLENSIDAGAHSVIVDIKGAASYIRITDDGSGIVSDEIETAFLRHATSKISNISDLDNIQSLGFRGEALASISAVSRLTVISRTHEENFGIKLVLHAGKPLSKEKTGCNPGTTIIVEDLFYNTPARRKFMQSDSRETSAIIELVQQYAISYPHIRFVMINKNETLFSTDGSGDSEAVIKIIYPDKAHSDLLQVNAEGIRGYISDPGITLGSRKGQLFFVNGRPVASKIIEKAVTDGYGGRIFSGFPVAILFIESEPGDVDVNIHPGKREILFLHPEDVKSRISSAVDMALKSENSVPNPALLSPERNYHAITEERRIQPGNVYEDDDTGSYSASSGITDKPSPLSISEYLSNIQREASEDVSITDVADRYNSSKDRFDFGSLRIKGYVLDTYIITESDSGIYIFDQHAAHERIFYEKILGSFESSEKKSQPLLSPIIINVSADVYELKDEIIEALRAMGYDIEDFGQGSFIFRQIPLFMSASEAEGFVKEFCNSSDFKDYNNNIVMDKLIMKSCKSAVKGGDCLSDAEIKSLIDELSGCKNPFSCPHGRPTFIRITRYDIERSFKRK